MGCCPLLEDCMNLSTRNDWQRSQASGRKELYALLGALPPRNLPLKAKTVKVEERAAYRLETLVLDLNGMEPVPAYFASPLGARGPLPCMLYNHAHGGAFTVGKAELIDIRQGIQAPPYAEELTSRGYCALCIDTWNFGDRRGRTELELFKEMLWRGRVLWGLMVYDNLRAVDYLASRPDVDSQRLGTIGISMGSTMAWWTAALDQRIRVCIDLCCLTDFDALLATRGLDQHGMYYYVPDLLRHFSSGQINALIAPRAHLSLAGNLDPLTPPAGLDRIDRQLRRAYRDAGVPEAWRLVRSDTGHFETAAMRAEIVAFLAKWL